MDDSRTRAALENAAGQVLVIALETTDAAVWAREFCKEYSIFTDDGVISDKEGLMLAWFANAIERGRDAGVRAAEPRPGDKVDDCHPAADLSGE